MARGLEDQRASRAEREGLEEGKPAKFRLRNGKEEYDEEERQRVEKGQKIDGGWSMRDAPRIHPARKT